MISLEFSDARSSAIPTPTWQYFVMKIINTYRSPDKVTIGNLSCKQVLNFFTSKYCRKNNLAGHWKFPLVQKSMIEAAKPVVACSDSKVAGFAPFPEAMIFFTASPASSTQKPPRVCLVLLKFTVASVKKQYSAL